MMECEKRAEIVTVEAGQVWDILCAGWHPVKIVTQGVVKEYGLLDLRTNSIVSYYGSGLWNTRHHLEVLLNKYARHPSNEDY